jgi:hypothetical protein
MAKDINYTIRATRDSNKKRKRKGNGEEEKDELMDGSNEKQSSSSKAAKQMETEPDSKTLKREREAMQAGKKPGEVVDWQKAASRRRVNDVVQAPPTLTKAPRGQSKSALENKAKLKALLTGTEVSERGQNKTARLPDPVQKGGLKRQAMLQEERDRAIKAYRRNKQAKLDSR